MSEGRIGIDGQPRWEDGVSRETLEHLRVYAEQLSKWSKRINLIGPGTVSDIWDRHIADSWQLPALFPDADHWVDLGTGAGLPGMVIAIAAEQHLAQSAGCRVELVESNRKKTAFLRAIKPLVAPHARIHDMRLEDAIPTIDRPVIVTARALASLDQLLAWTEGWLSQGTIGLFPKGRGFQQEIELARSRWAFECAIHQSSIDPDSVILEIRSLRSLQSPQA